jgi:hypothetical protein
LLFAGALDAIHAFYETFAWDGPNIWWPEDRAWTVGTDIDLYSSYVAGSRPCIDAVLANEELESWPAQAEDLFGWESDTFNLAPPRGLRLPGN